MIKTFTRIQSNDRSPAYSSHISPDSSPPSIPTFHNQSLDILNSLQIPSFPLFKFSLVVSLPWINFRLKIDFSLLELPKNSTPPSALLRAFQDASSHYPDFRVLFTSGSKNQIYTGCGISNSDHIFLRFSLPSSFTVLLAELFAIKIAVDHIASEESSTSYLIYSHSFNALQCLEKPCDTTQHPIAKEVVRVFH